MGSVTWPPPADRISRGAEPPPWLLEVEQERIRRGLPGRQDCELIARSATVSIWHTDKVASDDVPRWVPPFQPGTPRLYRGFAHKALRTVLETGLDVPEHAAFFATNHRDKAWEYPTGRAYPALLVLDESKTARSFVCKPADAGADWVPDTAVYPRRYLDGSSEVHSRFESGHGTYCFLDETMYGYWVPGDARTALIAVVLGGPRRAVLQLLDDVSEHVSLELLR